MLNFTYLYFYIYLGSNNAAMLAAAAVRAAAFASSRSGRAGVPQPNHMGGMNSYPFGLRGFPPNNEQMQTPFVGGGGVGGNISQQPTEFGRVMSPNPKDLAMNAMSPLMNQGRRTPRSHPPPPYSPLPQTNESSHSASGSGKGSMSNISNQALAKTAVKIEESLNHQSQNIKIEGNYLFCSISMFHAYVSLVYFIIHAPLDYYY